MKSMFGVFAVLLLVTASPLLAQDRDMQITPWASQVDLQGENEFEDGLTSEFEDGTGMGLSFNRFFSRYFSVEGSVFSLRNEARLLIDEETPINLGRVKLTPITLGVQFHPLRQSRIDPYIGAGGAYVLTNNLSSSDLSAGGVGPIDLEDTPTYYLNAGIGVQILGGLGIVVDGRYIPVETESRSELTGVTQDLEFSPRILSVGLRLRF
jgi:outer membrane protein W